MKHLLSIFIVIFLTACTESTTTTNVDSNTKVAYLYDTAIDGVEYRCNNLTGITGKANSNQGSFFYQENCDLTFYIGKIYLGKISSSNLKPDIKIYPTNLINTFVTDSNNPKVVNILRFLQTLDEDNNTVNGITISQNTRDVLNYSTTTALDLTSSDINETMLQNAITKAYPNRKLITSVAAISHFEETLRTYVDENLDTVAPAKPYVTNPITFINNQYTKNKDFEVNGEIGAKIFVAFNSDGNESNLNFIDYNTTIGTTRKAIINLDFNDSSITHFHYYIRLQDVNLHNSDYLHLDILKDDIPPYANQNVIYKSVTEEQRLVLDVNVTDVSDINYSILNHSEDNRSVDYTLFQIDTSGFVTFKVDPNFEEDQRSYRVVVRTIDEAGNNTDVELNVRLINLLDNPPALTNNSYTKDILETNISKTFVYDLSSTLKSIDDAPDNEYPVKYTLNNYTDLFDLNNTTGELTIKDASDDFFDFEKNVPHNLDLNISIENNNTYDKNHIDTIDKNGTIVTDENGDPLVPYNKIDTTLTINVLNKIDTTPSLINPNDINISEHHNPSIYTITTINKNEPLCDKDLSMNFSINGADGHFTINNSTGQISTTGDTLDFETKKQYTLTITATNTWWDGSTHSDDVNLTINIENLIDNAPLITFTSQTNILPESTDANITVATIDTNGSIYDQNQTTSYSILTSNTPFIIDSITGRVYTSRQLLNDYEETLSNDSITNFKVNIIAKNTWWDNSLHNSNVLVLDLNLTNVIDNPPKIEPIPKQYIDENVTTWSYQVDINGTNFDSNKIDGFRIISGDDNKFIISNSGLLELNSSLDWETKTKYTLNIDAYNMWPWDGNTTKHYSNPITFDININNIIEKSPKIYAPSVINVHENTDGDTILVRLDINSTEVDEQSINSFSIVDGNDGNFTLDSTPILDYGTNKYYGYLKLSGLSNKRGNLKYDSSNQNFYDLNISATNEINTSYYNIRVNVLDDVDTNLDLLVILLEYADINFSTSYPDIENLMFTNGGGTDKYLLNYFSRVSKDKFTFQAARESFDTSPASNGIVKVTLSSNHPTTSVTQLKQDILNSIKVADDNVSFSYFDKNSDGIITKEELQILYIVAGGERSYGDENQSINAITDTYDSLDDNLTLDGVTIKTNFTAVGELINNKPTTIGLIARFLSEKLFGFTKDGNDKYRYDYFDIMGEGFKGHEANETLGRTPVHPSIYNKMKQGWVVPKVLDKNETIEFFNTHDNVNFNAIKVNTNDPKLYYLIENRNQANGIGDNINYDDGLFGKNEAELKGGLVIWEVNENIPSINIVQITNSIDPNIFNTSNATGDLVNDYFEFNDRGTIEDDTKKYIIGINKK